MPSMTRNNAILEAFVLIASNSYRLEYRAFFETVVEWMGKLA